LQTRKLWFAAAGLATALTGCPGANVPVAYQWNASGTAAAFIPEPSSPSDPHPLNCQDAPYYWGIPDNSGWSQTTSTGMMHTCTLANGHVVNQVLTNNTVATVAPVGMIVPAAVASLTNGLPAAALLRNTGAAINVSQTGSTVSTNVSTALGVTQSVHTSAESVATGGKAVAIGTGGSASATANPINVQSQHQ
jgi:hypothetical protein